MKALLFSFALILTIPCTTFAQAWGPGEHEEYVRLLEERRAAFARLDSVDYTGYMEYTYFRKDVPVENTAPFRYQPPSDGIPLFVYNPGFESGNYTAWNGYIGDNTVSSYGPLQNQTAGIFSGNIDPSLNDGLARQNIMSDSSGTDSLCSFSIVPPGYGHYVARLGNTTCNYQGQEIEQTWVVTPHDSMFCISYAVVINNGGHQPGEGGYFKYELVDSSGTVIASRFDEADALPVEYNQSIVALGYLPWKTDTFDLTAYVGNSVTIRFITGGCLYGGHFAYCYLDLDPNNASTTGIAESEERQISVYPNPSSTGIYSVNCSPSSTESKPEVTDMSGRIVNATVTRVLNGWIIDISESAPGIYSVSLNTTTGIAHCSLIR